MDSEAAAHATQAAGRWKDQPEDRRDEWLADVCRTGGRVHPGPEEHHVAGGIPRGDPPGPSPWRQGSEDSSS
jgi:hypothetical protein